MSNIGLIRVGAAVPSLKVANTKFNSQEIIRLIHQAEKENTAFLLFPELAVTGYTCGDLFYQEHLYQTQLQAIQEICRSSKGLKVCVIIGCYLRVAGNFYNCAIILQNGRIKGAVPKTAIPNSRESNEARWFASGTTAPEETIRFLDQDVPFGQLLFRDSQADIAIALEICEDLMLPVSPGEHLAIQGANILFNPSASNETVGKAEYRRKLITVESAKCKCAYVYTSAGVTESTTDFVFAGHSIIAENGVVLTENQRFQRESEITYTEIDVQRINVDRLQTAGFNECAYSSNQIRRIELEPLRLIDKQDKLFRKYSKNPFEPEDTVQAACRYGEMFYIQTAGLAKRLDHSRSQKTVIGISGGLDSTLALLVCVGTHKLLNRPVKDIIAVTMPGFGTTGRTYDNAMAIMQLLGVEIREISIKDSVIQHFKDIGHDEQNHDVTYENAQARERTQILMDIANKEAGMVIGTGDLSEMALGWCTYNGDHMSMYGVNAGVPKTLVGGVIKWVMENRLAGPDQDSAFSADNNRLIKTLRSILDTPISPELLPPDPNGDIAQKTEDSIGPYQLHDFFIYYTVRFGMPPEKLLFIASRAFEGEYDEGFIQKWLVVFYRRFFAQQFKRSCMPDGPKLGIVGLSPRGDWQMPSDADAETWIAQLTALT